MSEPQETIDHLRGRISQLENELATATNAANEYARQVAELTKQLREVEESMDSEATPLPDFIPGVTHLRDEKGVWQKLPNPHQDAGAVNINEQRNAI